MAWQYLQTAWLSKQGSVTDFTTSGLIPVRSDVAATPEVRDDTLVTPFVQAAANVGTWPNNPKTAQMQTAVGQAISGVISGQLSATDAAKKAEAGVSSARKAGGGGC